MTSDARRLRLIGEHASELASYLNGVDLDEFLENRLLQRASERLLTIVGEAAKALTPATREAIDQPWREIMRFRDKGIHGDDSLSARTLYRIATESIPSLQEAVEAHLASQKL